jgi:hypothetical protein
VRFFNVPIGIIDQKTRKLRRCASAAADRRWTSRYVSCASYSITIRGGGRLAAPVAIVVQISRAMPI